LFFERVFPAGAFQTEQLGRSAALREIKLTSARRGLHSHIRPFVVTFHGPMPRTYPLSLTPDLVELCFREESDPGLPANWQPLSEDDYAALGDRLTAEIGDAPLWIFAYGSLIWKPGFESIDRKRATAFGWHRSFSLQIERGRASPQQPGLMMMLSRGGRCDGVIYRVADDDKRTQIDSALRREVSHQDSLSTFRWLPVRTSEGEIVRALTFWVGGDSPRILRPVLPLEEVAPVLARACGHRGSGAEYLYNTVVHLAEFGIYDRNLWRLQHLVAQEIRALQQSAATDSAD
jgi:cation transport protein ChaC